MAKVNYLISGWENWESHKRLLERGVVYLR